MLSQAHARIELAPSVMDMVQLGLSLLLQGFSWLGVPLPVPGVTHIDVPLLSRISSWLEALLLVPDFLHLEASPFFQSPAWSDSPASLFGKSRFGLLLLPLGVVSSEPFLSARAVSQPGALSVPLDVTFLSSPVILQSYA